MEPLIKSSTEHWKRSIDLFDRRTCAFSEAQGDMTSTKQKQAMKENKPM